MSAPLPVPDADVDRFERERPRLVGLAYRMLGSLADAEDVVQEAWMRWAGADRTLIEQPPAWLTTTVSRLGLDRLRARQRDRSTYVGPWLPEPLVQSGRGSDPAAVAEVADSLTTAFLLVLEQLTPDERLALLLVDVFGEPYPVVADALDRNEPSVRQLTSRARRKLREGHVEQQRVPTGEQAAVARAFADAALRGDVDAVLHALAPDVVLVSDGGAARHAARRPVVGPDRVARFVVNLSRRLLEPGVTAVWTIVNGLPGMVVRHDGEPVLVMAVEVGPSGVQRITSMLNPDKLAAVDRPIDLV
jgi:RNA polymerase sigma-70 factor (ECF subfamily)